MFIKNILRLICIFGIILTYAGITCYESRQLEVSADITPFVPDQNTTVFAAYSQDGTIPDYVVQSLKRIKEVSPNIIYITDNKIRRGDIKKIAPFVNRIEAKRHGEYDWGSFKRGFNWLQKNNHHPNKLIFTNDSVLTVIPSLTPIFTQMKDKSDFWGITANIDGMYHLQSYFLVFNPNVYNHIAFASYLNAVRPQKNGLEVAYRYEVPFTSYLNALGFKDAAYIPYENIVGLPLNDKHCYPLTMLQKYHLPFLKMRTFTDRLIVKEPRRLVFKWLKENAPQSYTDLITHLKNINSPYLKEDRS